MADSAEALDLRRRARRRLIGAIALVLALVIVPPWVMDLEPRPVPTDLSVQIPGRDSRRLAPPALPGPAKAPERAAPAKQAGEEKPAAPAPPAVAEIERKPRPAPEPAKAAAPKPAPKPETVARAAPGEAAKKDSEARRAEAILNAEAYVVPLGAFANKANVKSLEGKLAKAGVKYYTETIPATGGEQTRVRAGPYPTRDAAEEVREQLKELGLAPGKVISKQ